jgi:Spy/CpxP family protein refolding chaperone
VKILSRLIAILALVSLSQVCLAAEQAEKTPEMKMDHPMGKMDESKMMDHLKMRQEQILKMHDLSNKILSETDPKKKQALKDEQLELIKAEHMQMMSMHHSKMMNMGK